jgi:hypothetical protein
VPTTARLPAVFAWALADLFPAGGEAAGFLVLRPRDRTRRLVRRELPFTVEPGDGETRILDLEGPAGCPLVALSLAVEYPWWTPLLRPAPLVARFDLGGSRVARARLVPVADGAFEVFVHLGRPADFAALWRNAGPQATWDRLVLWPVDQPLAVSPSRLEVDRIACVSVSG